MSPSRQVTHQAYNGIREVLAEGSREGNVGFRIGYVGFIRFRILVPSGTMPLLSFSLALWNKHSRRKPHGRKVQAAVCVQPPYVYVQMMAILVNVPTSASTSFAQHIARGSPSS